MPLPAIIFGSLFLLLLVAMALVVTSAVRRSKQGQQVIAERGWTRLPDGTEVTAGWDGWPFRAALEPGAGTARDIVTGHHQGVEFLCLRWTQRESGRGETTRGELERYNILAVRCEQSFPPLSVVRGDHKMDRRSLPEGVEDFEVGDGGFDRRWQLVGDPGFGREVLVPEVRAGLEELGHGWAFQPGWVTRVVPWKFWAGEDQMVAQLDELAAPLRRVPHDVWRRHGGSPRFLQSLGHGPVGD